MYLRCGYWNNNVNVPLVTLLVRHAYSHRIIILIYFQLETIFDDIAQKSRSCSLDFLPVSLS